jgi:hypothetical protein
LLAPFQAESIDRVPQAARGSRYTLRDETVPIILVKSLRSHWLKVAAAAMVVAAMVGVSGQTSINDRIVFVSRQIPTNGSIYYSAAKDMPGVGPHSRFRVAAPGKLAIREISGSFTMLVDGSAPTAASLNLIDVNAPDVSYDGRQIVFAGLKSGNYGTGPVNNPGAWRLYRINVDGTGLQQIPVPGQSLNYAQFGSAGGGLQGFDDTDPAWLPDGRIVFSSTRYPAFSQYSGVRTTNLYVVNADGSGLRRITSERNGADRPMVDPITGKIVYSRWWRNHRFALNDQTTVADPNGGFIQKDGLSANRSVQLTGTGYAEFLWRNVWNPATINPDGTGLAAWGGSYLQAGDGSNDHVYGGAFSPNGEFFANFFPMFNMTEAAGFGGIRRYPRGQQPYTTVSGVTFVTGDQTKFVAPNSFGIYTGTYSTEPDFLSDGGMVISWAPDVNQDYGLYRINADGSGRTLIFDSPGTTELRARVVRPRPLPPVIPDTITQVASLLPPAASGPYDIDGTFTFAALNVYANAPVDTDIVNAVPVGSAATIRFFIDHQRTSPGSFPNLDWPVMLGERAIAADGSITATDAPANVSLFEQLRSPDGTVPITRAPDREQGAGHVAGMNFGRPGVTARCVGCHIGHTMIPVPANAADAQWTNLATGAKVVVSSSRDPNSNGGLTDRRVLKSEIWRYWTSANGQNTGQWARLEFPVPVQVRTVRLYNPRQGDEANSTLKVTSTNVKVCADTACNTVVATGATGAVAVSGTDVPFADVPARAVLVNITGMTGTFYGAQVASLAEIEVIARGGSTGGSTPPSSPGAPSNLRIIQ